MATPQLAYRFGLRKLRYFHTQEEALRYAETLGPQHVMLKWGAYIFGVLPSYDYVDALFDGGAHLAPPFFGIERPDVPMYQTLVQTDKPQIPYMDVEWYEDDSNGVRTTEPEARARLKRIIDLMPSPHWQAMGPRRRDRWLQVLVPRDTAMLGQLPSAQLRRAALVDAPVSGVHPPPRDQVDATVRMDVVRPRQMRLCDRHWCIHAQSRHAHAMLFEDTRWSRATLRPTTRGDALPRPDRPT